ncbi:hypothetical protein GGTG_00476 [Gaeumannomyces tritici R3-111a-1]|uniref:Uncharacterized protein n=1 Tax=Gaeumannomyces tritici (strain R3-111a-1) TaxID=644352 RepID=J3NGT7_GAET3|nr:hypothetical protein GGTG_00476 [Gaeumannomyces tritici R3-111a-1]EJT80477.1 hypothetical protein GGTG_00476 [Gaeumannomyces tritici R3-111a-1]
MDGIYDTAAMVGNRVKTNLGSSFTNMSAQQWIRLVAVVGAYMLLRPYLLKLAERTQRKQLEKEEAEREAEAAQQRAAISPNELRGRRIEIPDDSDSDDDGGSGKPAVAQWGKKARRRQRAVARRMVEESESRLADAEGDEDDKDIEEFLVG